MSSFAIQPADSKTAQEISIDLSLKSDRTDVFSSPYLLATFEADTYQPIFSYMHKPRAFVDGVETEFRAIETMDMDLDSSIQALYIDIPEKTRASYAKQISVTFTGFKNPSYVDQSNLSGTLHAQVLGDSLDRWQVRAVGQHTFETNLSPSEFDSLALFSTKPWPAQDTFIEIDFSMTNQITNE